MTHDYTSGLGGVGMILLLSLKRFSFTGVQKYLFWTGVILEEKLLNSLPPNKKITYNPKSYYHASPEAFFTLKDIPSTYKSGEKKDFFLILDDNVDINICQAIMIEVLEVKDDKNYAQIINHFNIEQKLNKIPITFNIKQGNYTLEIGILTFENDRNYFRQISKEITIK